MRCKKVLNTFFTFTFTFPTSKPHPEKQQLLLRGELSDEMQKSHFPAVMATLNSEHKHKDEFQAETLKTFGTERARAKRINNHLPCS